MINFIQKRKIAYTISGILVLASWIFLIVFGLKSGMDFIGGSLLELKLNGAQVDYKVIEDIYKQYGYQSILISPHGEGGLTIRSTDVSEENHQLIISQIKEKYNQIEEMRFESFGPTIGKELRNKSITAIILVIVFIIIYLTWAFRQVSRPVASWRYGVTAILALIHDISIPTGLFALLGHLKGIEIDSNFIVALLVVLGFSVHDTIVVFDRIREKLRTHPGLSFEQVINESINETMRRSILTSATLVLVLLTLLIFGPLNLFYFTLTLLVGTFFGTYSSIFIASPLLYDWQLFLQKRKNKR
ncbi:MAG: protein translocase subunit SecF [Patescibacteria group bacterium]|jgi:preprotein translocase subunit SecF|nr:protein translocase subunit SecF [Patescibacteria group bacterium]